MAIQQPGRGSGVGRSVFTRCGQGGQSVKAVNGPRRRTPIFRTKQFAGFWTVSGVTKDAAGAALAGCTVKLFASDEDRLLATTVSDGAGAYSFINGYGKLVYLTAYLPGGPDVAGITINTIQPAP